MRKAILCLPVVAALSCSSGPADALLDMQKAFAGGKKENIRQLYTKGTVNALAAFDAADPEGGGFSLGDRLFDREARWVVVDENAAGNVARVRVRYTRHSAENMRGFEYVYTLRREDGAWRVDMEKEVRSTAAMAEKYKRKVDAGR